MTKIKAVQRVVAEASAVDSGFWFIEIVEASVVEASAVDSGFWFIKIIL